MATCQRIHSFPTAVCDTPVTILPAKARYPPTVTIAAGNTTGEANIAPPTSPITNPIVRRVLKNLGVGAITLSARDNSTSGIFDNDKLLFFIFDRIIKDTLKLFHFGLDLSNSLIDQL